jgi:hypothetical protein
MTQLFSIGPATQSPAIQSPSTPQPVAAPLASMADRPFAYVLRGLVEAQLARSAAAPTGLAEELPIVMPGPPSVIIGPSGPSTVGAFALWSRLNSDPPPGT